MTGRDISLADIRREIDAIDDGIVDLLVRRAAAQKKVKANKEAAGGLAISPVRPAREAEILRRVVKRAGGNLDPEFLVRLWRHILVTSTLSQATVRVHAARAVAASEKLFGMVTGHFGTMPLVVHGDEAGALAALGESPGDLAVIETASGWAAGFANRAAGQARILGVLPIVGANSVPPLLLAGHAEAAPTGDDCTLLISRQAIHANALWSVAAGGMIITCLEGFLDDEDIAARGIAGSPDITVAGRFPGQIKV